MISTVTWIVWAIIGFCGGYMCAKLLFDGERVVILDLVGIAGALLGGWTLVSMVQLTPENTEFWQYLSMLTSLAGAALLLWIAVIFLRRQHPLDHDPDDPDEL